jgi:hypothetical protein
MQLFNLDIFSLKKSSSSSNKSRSTQRRLIWLALPVFLVIFAEGQLTSSHDIHASSINFKNTILGPGEYDSFTPAGDIRRFAGESLIIDISFLSLFNAAKANISFYEKGGTYYSILESETKGFVGFVTAYRKHRYKSTFEVVDNGRRLRTKKFEQEIITGKIVEKVTHIFDYDNRLTWSFEYKNGKMISENQRKLPEGFSFEDILATFYNFRNSVYGKVQKQAKYNFTDQGAEKIAIYISSEEEANRYGKENGHQTRENELLLKAVIPKDVFKTENGELMFWVSKHLIPLETTVKDYILLGDLHAVLKERNFTPPA